MISVVFHAALPCEIMIIYNLFFGYCIFLQSTKINGGPPKVGSLVGRMSTNVLSAISKTDLHWSKHIQGLASKASSTLGLLRRNLSLCPQKLREQANISLIRSRLEYCAAIWDLHLEKDIQQLEAIQRRAARFVVQDFSRYSSVKSYLNDLKWAPLKDRLRDIRLAYISFQYCDRQSGSTGGGHPVTC